MRWTLETPDNSLKIVCTQYHYGAGFATQLPVGLSMQKEAIDFSAEDMIVVL